MHAIKKNLLREPFYYSIECYLHHKMDKNSEWNELKPKNPHNVKAINEHIYLKKSDMQYIWNFIDGNANITMAYHKNSL